MARPAKPANRRKGKRRSVRLNEDEDRILLARVKEDGLSISDQFRRAVSLPPRKKDPEVQQLIRLCTTLLGQVGKLGSNHFQMLRIMRDGSYPETPRFERAADDIAAMRAEIMKFLRTDHTDRPAPG